MPRDCRAWTKFYTCSYGDKCNYLHGDLDKRFNGGQGKGAAYGSKGNYGVSGGGVGNLSNMARNSASSTRNSADSTVASASVQKVLQIAGPKYKTQLCHYFTAGYCYDEEMCPYAHGDDELEAALANRLPQQLVFNASPAALQSPSEVLMKSTPLPGNLFEGQNCWSVTSVTSPANEEWLPSGSQGKVLSADPDDSRRVIVLFETPGGEVFRVRMPTSLVQKSKPVLPGEFVLNEECFYVDNDGAVPFGSAAIIVGPWDAAALLNGGTSQFLKENISPVIPCTLWMKSNLVTLLFRQAALALLLLLNVTIFTLKLYR